MKKTEFSYWCMYRLITVIVKQLLFLLKILNGLYCSNVMVFYFLNVLVQPCYNIITQNSFLML